MTSEAISMPVPQPTLAQVITNKIREGASLEETKEYYRFLREIQMDEARIAFSTDFVDLQGALPEVPKLGRIGSNTGKGYAYARWEDINDKIKPVLQQHGFALNFEIIEETETYVTIQATLRHRGGHSISTCKKLPLDKSGSKNIVQQFGSTQSYGQRYAAIALLNLTSREEDDDGKAADGTNENLSTEQAAKLAQAIEDSGRTVEWFCAFAHIEVLPDLAASRYEAALGYVNKLPKVQHDPRQ